MTSRDINEIADTPAGIDPSTLQAPIRKVESEEDVVQSKADSPPGGTSNSTRLSYASMGQDGKVAFDSRST